MEHSGHAVAARNLAVSRGARTVLSGIELVVQAGQVTGLLGPSGCGKSTLLRAIVGVQARVSGEITVLGQPAGSRGLRRSVAYATQAASVYDDLTVEQNLRYFERVLGAPSGDAQRVIALVGLQDHAAVRVDALSGGQRSRVSLAVALLGEPQLIVLDEPTVGLDPVLRAELWTLFRSLAVGGATLIVSSHVMDEALRCDRLLLMREGAILADTTPTELLTRTGTTDPEQAFLALIAAGSRTGPHIGRHGADSHPDPGVGAGTEAGT
ncbi:ABC-2 type transport system ATP-binding protein [Leucobacter luti]|uniref:ABC-2 type transport system ATP-binding protein n=1 Tax=Leucobacter luti TaxID=340320 RepID=A0A4R6RVI3_9MICO|nr:ABC transporter ATP-binding protein [Leucobacter luti]TDP90943.1 ABC-2 type transport system ATP-binding protein [Leucobacter luti]